MRARARWKAVTLDVGGTLVEPWPSVGAVYAEAAERAGFGVFEAGLLDRRFAAAWRARGDFDYSTDAWARVVADTFHELTPRAADPRLFTALYAAFAEARAWRVFPDVWPALEGLRAAGVRLGVVSNWDRRLGPLLEALDLARFFDLVLVSGEVGIHKPAPGIFTQAVRHWGFQPHEVLHVGDSRREDLEGAQAAGVSALLIDRSGGKRAPGSLASLLDLVDRMGNEAASSAVASGHP